MMWITTVGFLPPKLISGTSALVQILRPSPRGFLMPNSSTSQLPRQAFSTIPHPLILFSTKTKTQPSSQKGKGGGGVFLTKLSTGHAPLSFRSMVSLPLAGCCGKSRCSSLLRVVCWAMAVGCPADLGVWGQVLLTTVVCLRGKRVLARREGLAFLVD